MSKFDEIYQKHLGEQFVTPTSTAAPGQTKPDILQGLVGQMSKGIQNRNQQSEKDLHNLVDAIQKKDKNTVDNIVKKYAEMALLAQQKTGQGPNYSV